MWRRVLCTLLAVPLAVVGVLATTVSPAALSILYLAAVTPWLVASDVREHRLPNVLVVPGIGVGLACVSGEWIVSGHPPVLPLVTGVAYALFLFLVHALGGMGMGDVKLAAALGLASWSPSIAVLSPVITFLVGGLVSMVLLIVGRRGQRIAFGPFLLGGFWAAVLLVALAGLVAPQVGPVSLSLYR